jgi:hypothetical protein
MNDSARPKRSDSAMGNGFDMEFERKREKLKANNKRVVSYFKWRGRGTSR